MPATRLRLGFWIVAGILVALGALWLFTASPFATSSSHTADCENLVAQQLRSPSTATYQSTSPSDTLIIGTVTADNAYGTPVTSEYRCTIVDTAGGPNVRLDELTPTP